MKEITASEIIPLIKGGKFFSVDFVKKDGTLRTLTGRLGVSKHTTGQGLNFNPVERGMIPVWESNENNRKSEKDAGYRMVTLNRVKELRVQGEVYIVKNS